MIGRSKLPSTCSTNITMVEPFSLASSAAGIISLGLQVCQQLVTYCQSYQSFDEDINNIFNRASRLQYPLESLREMIDNSQITDADIARDLEQKLDDLKRIVDQLHATVNQYKPSLPSSCMQDKFQQHMNKFVYPFRKSGLRDVASDLDSLQAVLQTTLHIYSVQRMAGFCLVQEKVLEEVKQIRLTLQDSPCRVIPPPSLVQSWEKILTDHAQSIKANLDLTAYHSPNTENFNDLSSTSDNQSRSRARYREKSVLKSYRYLNTLFRVAIKISFSMSVGAGGFSISPSLRLQKVSDLETSLPWIVTKMLRGDRVSNESCAFVFERAVNDCISQLQNAFTEKKITPFDAYFYAGNNEAISIVDAVIPWNSLRWRDEIPSLRRLTRFLIECGSLPDNTLYFGVLISFLSHVDLKEEDLPFIAELVHFGGPLLISDLSLELLTRRNIKFIVSKDEGLVSFSEAEMMIFREAQDEFQKAAELGKISPVDTIHGSPSLLSIAFGWPQGVDIILKQVGADAKKVTLESLSYRTKYIDELDVDFNAYYESTRLVLEAGCMFGVSDIERRFSRKLRSLLAHELAKRRWALWSLAESQLPPQNQIKFEIEKDTVPDIHAASICKAFAAQGREIGSYLQVEKQSSVYHEYSLSIEAMEELFSAGFRDLDCLDSSGMTPLMITRPWLIGLRWPVIRRAAWMISKGADSHRGLPRSNATISHLLSAELTGMILLLSLNGSLQPGHPQEYQFWMERISPCKYPIFVRPSFRDNCACACCPSGCTILSVALRQVCRWKWWPYVYNRSFIFRRILRMVIEFTQSGPSVNQTVIRCLSFDAVGLRHICCTEIEDRETAENMESMEDSEISEILEEDTRGFEELEQLVFEFERKFDEIGIPILDFLESYWHKRMVEYLSNRDPYDEEHNSAMNLIGIQLSAEESVPFDRVSLLIGNSYDEDYDKRAKAIDLEAGENLALDNISLLLHAQGYS